MANCVLLAVLIVAGVAAICLGAPSSADDVSSTQQQTPIRYALPPHLQELLKANANGGGAGDSSSPHVIVGTSSKNGTVSTSHVTLSHDDKSQDDSSKPVTSVSSSSIKSGGFSARRRNVTTTTEEPETSSSSSSSSTRRTISIGSFAV